MAESTAATTALLHSGHHQATPLPPLSTEFQIPQFRILPLLISGLRLEKKLCIDLKLFREREITLLPGRIWICRSRASDSYGQQLCDDEACWLLSNPACFTNHYLGKKVVSSLCWLLLVVNCSQALLHGMVGVDLCLGLCTYLYPGSLRPRSARRDVSCYSAKKRSNRLVHD
uniref:Uncharacterized protein n=1 Tax=Oryza brachyantha TaxID=4533 RepID=J3LP55_ORYBR